MSAAAGPVAPRGPGAAGNRATQVRLLLAMLLLLGLAVAFAGNRALQTYRAYRRLSSPMVGTPGGVRVQDFVPLGVVARRYGVPESALVDALRDAGFVLEPRRLTVDFPEGVRRRFMPPGQGVPPGQGGQDKREAPGEPGSGLEGAGGGRLLGPAQQSLRQIARASGREPSDAVRVVEGVIGDYRKTGPGVTGAGPGAAPETVPSTPRGRPTPSAPFGTHP